MRPLFRTNFSLNWYKNVLSSLNKFKILLPNFVFSRWKTSELGTIIRKALKIPIKAKLKTEVYTVHSDSIF